MAGSSLLHSVQSDVTFPNKFQICMHRFLSVVFFFFFFFIFINGVSHMGIIAHLETVLLDFCEYSRSPATAAPLPTVSVKGLHSKHI